jgi:NodT family efflux transporter outer membrane factor (OMF) lipoprotein
MKPVNKIRPQSAFMRLTLGTMLLFEFYGCVTVGPDYVRPNNDVPAKWNSKQEASGPAKNLDVAMLSRWWTTLNDPELTSLIERAVQGNTDLCEAEARVREARARRGASAADQFPSVEATASASKIRSSSAVGGGSIQNQYSAGFDASWELDIFGGKRRSVEAAQADLEASEADRSGVLVSLTAEVALNYIDFRSYQARLAAAQSNLDAQEETFQITQWRLQAGLVTERDVEQAKSNLEQTRAQIPALRTNLEAAKNRLAVLLGKHPGTLHKELAEQKSIPVASIEIAVGVPADALRNRPDVRQRERKLAAQTAQIGVATADLYPKLSLTGSIGVEALTAKGLTSSDNRTWGVSLPLTWNIFDAGRIRQNIKVQNALQEQALIQYEASILSALEEVENALVAFAQEQSRREALSEADKASQNAVELAKTQYESGLVDFQVVLDAERSRLAVQDSLVQSEAAVTSNLIRLYKALGGGWAPMTPETNIKSESKAVSREDTAPRGNS